MSGDRLPRPRDLLTVVAPGVIALLVIDLDLPSLALGLAGLAAIGVSTLRGSRRGVSVGGLVLVLAVTALGARSPRPEALLVVLGGAVVSWDSAQHVVGLRRQLGTGSAVYRSVLVHTGITVAVVTATGTLAVAVLRIATGLGTLTALAPLAVGVLALFVVLDRP